MIDRTNDTTPLVELNDVSHREGGKPVLRHVSWRICRGESWAILGGNGAGKTMLLRIVAGWLWPNAGGEVRRMGKLLLDLRQLRRSVGWVCSTMVAAIPPRERVLDTVVSGRMAQFGLEPTDWDCPAEEDYERAREQLQKLQATDVMDRRFGELSQGEQQKILLARALMAGPTLLILDEPCIGLDPFSRESFLDCLSLALDDPAGPSVLFVTHHMEEILPGLQQTLVMHQGRIVQQGLRPMMMQSSVLAAIYGRAPREIICRNDRYWPIW